MNTRSNRIRPGRYIALPILLASVIVLAACSFGTASAGESFDALRNQAEGATIDRQYSSAAELTNLIRQRQDEAGRKELVVVGKFTRVEPGVSFVFEVTADGNRRIDLPYGDPKAQTNTVHLTFEATETLAP